MKEKLIALLGLDTTATDDQVVSEVSSLKAAHAALVKEVERETESNSREKKIRKKIADSGGALNREQAALAIDHQEEADANRKSKARK